MTLFQGFGAFAGSGAGEKFNFETIKPSSVSVSTGTANIDQLASVEFVNVDNLVLNNIFSAEFSTYMVILSGQGTSGLASYTYLTSSGTATTTNYRRASSQISGTAWNLTTEYAEAPLALLGSGNTGLNLMWIHRPAHAQPTIYTTFISAPIGGPPGTARIVSPQNGIQGDSTAFDGLKFVESGGLGTNLMTGHISVYGVR